MERKMNDIQQQVADIFYVKQVGKTHQDYKTNARKYMSASNDSDYETPKIEDSVQVRICISEIIQKDLYSINHLPDNYTENRDICKSVVKSKPELLGLFKANVRDDDKVILECLNSKINKSNASFWAYVSPRLRQRKWLRDLAFDECRYVFKYFTPKQKANKAIGKLAFEHHPELFFDLCKELQNDWHIVLEYIEKTDKSLDYLKKRKVSKEIISKVGKCPKSKIESIAALYRTFLIPMSKNNLPIKQVKI